MLQPSKLHTKCEKCCGSGVILVSLPDPDGNNIQLEYTCDECDGKGYVG